MQPNKEYDYVIVGSGLSGAMFSYEASKRGFKCLIVEKRSEIGGNVRTKLIDGINVHCYGPHIFHTSDREVWDYIKKFAEFNNFVYSPMANFNGELYNLPFNMNTFIRLFDGATPDEIKKKLNDDIVQYENVENLEQQAMSVFGRTIYEKLVKGYTEKQWGRPCSELPPFIIKRVPFRMKFDNNYYNDTYQGIPIGGYTNIIKKMIQGSDFLTDVDFLEHRDALEKVGEKVVFTGPIDSYFDYCEGRLEYRSLRFETEKLNMPNFQGVACVNYTSNKEPYTRIIEHKHFEAIKNDDVYSNPNTIITKEFPVMFNGENEPYYPINDSKNSELYNKYREMAEKKENVIFIGRLAEYKYYDMDKVIRRVLDYWKGI